MARNLTHRLATNGAAAVANAATCPLLHVRFGGRSFDLLQSDLEIGFKSGEAQVKQAVANHLEVPLSRLADCVVDRHPNGNLTLRPEAVFG